MLAFCGEVVIWNSHYYSFVFNYRSPDTTYGRVLDSAIEGLELATDLPFPHVRTNLNVAGWYVVITCHCFDITIP